MIRMQADGRSTSADTPSVAAGLVIAALIGLVLLNRLTVNASIGLK